MKLEFKTYSDLLDYADHNGLNAELNNITFNKDNNTWQLVSKTGNDVLKEILIAKTLTLIFALSSAYIYHVFIS